MKYISIKATATIVISLACIYLAYIMVHFAVFLEGDSARNCSKVLLEQVCKPHWPLIYGYLLSAFLLFCSALVLPVHAVFAARLVGYKKLRMASRRLFIATIIVTLGVPLYAVIWR